MGFCVARKRITFAMTEAPKHAFKEVSIPQKIIHVAVMVAMVAVFVSMLPVSATSGNSQNPPNPDTPFHRFFPATSHNRAPSAVNRTISNNSTGNVSGEEGGRSGGGNASGGTLTLRNSTVSGNRTGTDWFWPNSTPSPASTGSNA
jgi:hypothetical protein